MAMSLSQQNDYIKAMQPPPSTPRPVTKMLAEIEQQSSGKQSSVKTRKDVSRGGPVMGRTTRVPEEIDGESEEWDGELTEAMMMALLNDDSFMSEVVPLLLFCRSGFDALSFLGFKSGLTRR
jgi:hypothetical protein